MKTSRSLVIILTLVVLIAGIGSVEAFAQKKKPAAPPPPAAAEQQKTPAPPPLNGKGGVSLKDMLTHFKGQVTTIGRLKAVESDYILVDDDGTEMVYPVASIRSIKIIKQDEESPDEAAPKLDIKLQ